MSSHRSVSYTHLIGVLAILGCGAWLFYRSRSKRQPCLLYTSKADIQLQGNIREWVNCAGTDVNSAPVPNWTLGNEACLLYTSRCDRAHYTGEYKDKGWMQHLQPKETFKGGYTIEINE